MKNKLIVIWNDEYKILVQLSGINNFLTYNPSLRRSEM